MPTRRSTHARHVSPSAGSQRRAKRRGTSAGAPKAAHAFGRRGSRGGQIGTVGVSLGGSHAGTPTFRSASESGVRVRVPGGSEVLLTRRHFLFGALGVGVLAAAGSGAGIVMQKKREEEAANALSILQVPVEAVTKFEDLGDAQDASAHVGLVGNFELPYGTLVWANDPQVAACLVPCETAKPLSSVQVLPLSTGNAFTVLQQAVGLDEGFEIYDVRATSQGLVWTEADILDGVWRIYTARLEGSALGAPKLADEGDGEWETPAIAAVGSYAFWQVMPKANGTKSTEDSLVKRMAFGSGDAEVVYTSHGRLCTPPYALNESLVITPRADASGVYYQLTHLDAASGEVLDSLVLPRSMRPLEAGYGRTGFMFSFDAIYDYGEGIANLGTYVPKEAASDDGYSSAPWFRFSRTPSAAPAWCGKYFMAKGSSSVYGFDLNSNAWFALDVESGSDDYGEYLASTGMNDTVVTYANIDHQPLDGDAVKCCRVRVWAPTA